MSYLPKYGGDPILGFQSQFQSEPVSAISMATTPILLKAILPSTGIVSSATGFIWMDAEQAFLVTSRHVFTGTNAFDGQVNSQAFRPREIEIYPSGKLGTKFSRFGPLPLRLYDRSGVGLWFEDPAFEALKTDIAVLPINLRLPPEYSPISLNRDDYSKDIVSAVGMELVVVGYPSANLSGGMIPVWRRGMLASEPSLAIDQKPIFLIDAATGPSFSGSPVFRQHIGPAPYRSEDGKLSVRLKSVVSRDFVGVYSGRLAHTHIAAETAFAFYANRIPEIVRGQRRTSHQHPDYL